MSSSRLLSGVSLLPLVVLVAVCVASLPFVSGLAYKENRAYQNVDCTGTYTVTSRQNTSTCYNNGDGTSSRFYCSPDGKYYHNYLMNNAACDVAGTNLVQKIAIDQCDGAGNIAQCMDIDQGPALPFGDFPIPNTDFTMYARAVNRTVVNGMQAGVCSITDTPTVVITQWEYRRIGYCVPNSLAGIVAGYNTSTYQSCAGNGAYQSTLAFGPSTTCAPSALTHIVYDTTGCFQDATTDCRMSPANDPAPMPRAGFMVRDPEHQNSCYANPTTSGTIIAAQTDVCFRSEANYFQTSNLVRISCYDDDRRMNISVWRNSNDCTGKPDYFYSLRADASTCIEKTGGGLIASCNVTKLFEYAANDQKSTSSSSSSSSSTGPGSAAVTHAAFSVAALIAAVGAFVAANKC